ncbi:MAG: P-loop NTPase [Acidilobaceae archaeon]
MISLDPRLVRAQRLVRDVKNVYAIASSKGGVGKTTVSCLLSLLLSKSGLRVGLLDLDFTNATTHLILGADAENMPIDEGFGVKPIVVYGIKLATPVLFTRGNPLALRGPSSVNAMRELLTAVEWGELDVLVLDMPSGAKDELLEAIALGAKPLVVSAQDSLSVSSVKRLLKFLKSERVTSAGVIENMSRTGEPKLLEDALSLGFKHLGVLPYDELLQNSLGDPLKLLNTKLAKALNGALKEVLNL